MFRNSTNLRENYTRTIHEWHTQPQNYHRMTIFVMLWNDIFLRLYRAARETINTLNKTDKSKTRHLVFWREPKLQPDRPYLKNRLFPEKLISLFFHADQWIRASSWADIINGTSFSVPPLLRRGCILSPWINALIALTIPIPMLENGSFGAHNSLVVTVLQFFYSTLLYLLEFLGRNRLAEFPPQRFLTKSFLTARKARRKQIEWWIGLKIGPTTF